MDPTTLNHPSADQRANPHTGQRNATSGLRANGAVPSAETTQSPSKSLETIGALSSGIMHEINTPIQYVTDNVKFLEETVSQFIEALKLYENHIAKLSDANAKSSDDASSLEDIDLEFLIEEAPDAAEHALSGLKHVAKIIAAVKTFAHPSTDEKVLADLKDIISTTMTVSRNEWKYIANLDLNIDENLPLVPCHAAELHQVLLNLIVNAAHAIEEKGEKELGSININAAVKDDRVEIRIIDNGCGISQINAARIMEPFFTTKPVGKGTGQGLALCRSIIEDKHNGKISFESKLGVGSTFVIRLPLKEPKPNARAVS